ncbi:hypothetical protein GCK72_004709 [Caenorhabditis remanei]|uniref:Uncharacterized protein n=1 Tax=Caenorhabditis remanei TaxID=31234 RepID=A0A6A5HCM5_CAERE|nr:hypothetical protein GCK72_004709 [Caenorhabditis remanei]KAF1764759.1 hypothetical protein GCK72_004709 [Caenorhabditis remanei]
MRASRTSSLHWVTMHLSFCLLLFASLFGATVQKCCQYPVHYPENRPKNYQVLINMGCEVDGRGSKPYFYNLIGNFSTLHPAYINSGALVRRELNEASTPLIPLTCDTQTGLWFWNKPDDAYVRSFKYTEFCCYWSEKKFGVVGWPWNSLAPPQR